MSTPAITRNGKGKIRLDYSEGESRRAVLWEPMDGGVVETVFDGDGIVIRQILMPQKNREDTDFHLIRFINSNGIKDARESNETLTEITLKKQCPGCGNPELKRFTENLTDPKKAPVMPIYVCTSCKAHGYHLSDRYLEYLVDVNNSLFSEKERAEFAKNRSAALSELREYIIRIFASKKIARIR